MTRVRVLNTLPLRPSDIDLLSAVSSDIEIVNQALDAGAVAQLKDAEVQVLFAGRLPENPEATAALRWLQMPGGGLEFLNVPAGGLDAWPHAVTVTNGRGTYAWAIAELVMWGLFDFFQRSEDRTQMAKDRRWPPRHDEEHLLGRPLRGRTLLTVGYGSVGRRVARVATALGMRILAIKADPSRRPEAAFSLPGMGDPEGSLPERIGGPSDLPQFASEADVIVVTLPRTAQTTKVIDQGALSRVGPGALLISVGRGTALDLDAVTVALDDGRLARAVIDGFPEEPLAATDPLWEQAGLVITPHIGGGVAGYVDECDWGLFAQLAAENLRRFVGQEPLLNVVDVNRGY